MFNKFFCLLLILTICLVSCQNAAEVTPESEEPTAEAEEPAIELITEEDAAVPFEQFVFQDSTALIPGDSLTPWAFYQVKTLIPHAENAKLNRLINRTLGQSIAGDDYPMVPTNPALHLRAAARNHLLRYRKQEIDTVMLREEHAAYASQHDYETEVMLNKANLVSLAAFHYYFTGGVHGNYETTLYNFSVEPPKKLTYDDLFIPGTASAIAQLMTDYAQKTEMPVTDDITAPTKNVGLTDTAVIFNYPPYEIASYADGEQLFVLTYGELMPYLTEEAKALIAPLK